MSIAGHGMWDQRNETMGRDELAQLQLERLQASVFRAYRNVTFYRKRFDDLGLEPEDIQSFDDLRSLPFVTPDELRAGYPYDMLAVPLREVVRLHSVSWATGHPTVCAYTRNDLRFWYESVARLLTAGGITRDDVAQVFFGTHKLISGFGFIGGAECLGASVIPVSLDDIEQQIAIMQDFKTTVLIGTPGDAATLAGLIAGSGRDTRRLSLRVGLFGAEPWSEQLRAHIEEQLHIVALDTYTITEAGGPGIAGECLYKQGLHLAEDQFLCEILDPATGAPVPEGEEGELVITTLAKEAQPLLRFRTHDLTRLDTRPCACGRTLARMARISKRTDKLIFMQNVNLLPAQVEAILTEIEGAEPRFQLILDRRDGREEAELIVEVSPALFTDTPGKLLSVEERIITRVRRLTGLTLKIRLVEPRTFARIANGQDMRIIDRRA